MYSTSIHDTHGNFEMTKLPKPLLIWRAYQSATLALFRPYCLRELPGWGILYDRLCSWKQDKRWEGAPVVQMRGREHGYVVTLDLSKWSDRSTYFLGRWSDIAIQRLLAEKVEAGATVVDVGANRGEFALYASTVVRQGKVIAFEPNPECRAILLESIQRNEVSNIDVRPFGLSDASADLPLHFPLYNSGEGTFAGNNTFDKRQERIVHSKVEIGDEVLQDEPIALIKIDVEGFELRALRGLSGVLDRDKPLLIIEIAKSHLARAGTSPEQLFALLRSKGYVGAKLGHKKIKSGLTYNLQPLEDGTSGYDSLWMHGSDPAARDFEDLPLS